MRTNISAVILAAILLPSCGTARNAVNQAKNTASTADIQIADTPWDRQDSLSYALGIDYGSYLLSMQRKIFDTIRPQRVAEGISDALRESLAMTSDDGYAFMERYFSQTYPSQLMDAEKEYMESVTEDNPQAVRTESGLVYSIIEPGNSKRAKLEDTVKVKYNGVLRDGSVFDRTEGDETLSFILGSVIQGWGEGLQHIGEGGRIKLWIPSELAYGEEGTPDGAIGPYEPIIFDVELVAVNPPQEEKTENQLQ